VRRHPEDVERVRRATGIIYEEVLRLEAILSGVMDFTRPAAFKPEQRDLNDVVCRLVDPLREELREKSIEFVLALTQLPRVRIDEKQFHQALLNLIRNAIESVCASVPAERGRRLELRTRREGDAVCVDVRDNGEGVPDDLMPVLFEPFISRKAGGTGLGLAVVRKILLDHGGDATAVSRRGEGATFTLRLPLAAEEKGT
jgi:signal transduction histidine kinase